MQQLTMKKTLAVLALAVALIASMAIVFAPATAHAYTAKTSTTKTSTAPVVKKGITYKVTVKADSTGNKKHYVKFKAPSKGTYKFNVYNLAKKGYKTTSSKSGVLGGYTLWTKSDGVLDLLYARTNGGKTYWMNVESKYWYEKFKSNELKKDLIDRYLPTRYAKVALKKYQYVYLDMYTCGDATTYYLKITKVA